MSSEFYSPSDAGSEYLQARNKLDIARGRNMKETKVVSYWCHEERIQDSELEQIPTRCKMQTLLSPQPPPLTFCDLHPEQQYLLIVEVKIGNLLSIDFHETLHMTTAK